MSLVEKLVILRKQKGLTQMDLAERLNVSRQAISRWEVGAAIPSTENLRILSEIYETSVDYLLNDDAKLVTKDVDLQTTETGEYKGRSRVQKRWKMCIVVSIVLVLLAVIISVAIAPDRESGRTTPIENLNSEETDDLSTVTFPIE